MNYELFKMGKHILVTDPDATCRYSHMRHALNVLSWNCRCDV
jgi:hypothetical protein